MSGDDGRARRSPYAASQQAILLVDDDAIVRAWVREVLRGTEFRLVGEATAAAEAVGLAERRRPDLLLVDYRLGDGMGTDLVSDLRRRGISAPVVLMTANPERGFNETAREAGAQGTALKTGRADELLETLRRVARGLSGFDPRHPPRPPGQVALSQREREVMRLVSQGATNREIAEALGVGAETVKTLLSRATGKLGARKRAEAVAEAQRRGLL